MKLVFALSMLLCSTLTFATTPKAIAESAEMVTPLMNGQTVPNATIYTPDGSPVSLRALVMQKPTVFVFYRGGWCPYCNSQLAGLKEAEKKILELGYQIVAISPDSPERLSEQKFDSGLEVMVMSDKKFEATMAFGLGFYLDAKTEKRYRNKLGNLLTEIDGTSRLALPIPAVYIVDNQGLIHFNYANPNYKVRINPELIYQAAKLSEI